MADKTELEGYLGYIGAVKALTHYATCAEKLFLFIAVAGMLFNAGGMSQMASVTARLIILVLQADWDGAEEASYELLYWGLTVLRRCVPNKLRVSLLSVFVLPCSARAR